MSNSEPGRETVVQLTLPPPAGPADAAAPAQDYQGHGWRVVVTETGLSLITDDRVGGVELAGDLAAAVRQYLQVNGLLGPVIEIPGEEGREIHLVTGVRNAALAIAWLRENGATVHLDGTQIPLPPDELSEGRARWATAESLPLPPTVAISAAVRAVHRKRSKEHTEPAAS